MRGRHLALAAPGTAARRLARLRLEPLLAAGCRQDRTGRDGDGGSGCKQATARAQAGSRQLGASTGPLLRAGRRATRWIPARSTRSRSGSAVTTTTAIATAIAIATAAATTLAPAPAPAVAAPPLPQPPTCRRWRNGQASSGGGRGTCGQPAEQGGASVCVAWRGEAWAVRGETRRDEARRATAAPPWGGCSPRGRRASPVHRVCRAAAPR